MNSKHCNFKLSSFIFHLSTFLLLSCANRGVGPQGGPRDSIPPTVLKEKPLNGTLHFNSKKIEIYFDEYIQLTNVAANVVISPPQLHAPEIRALGKKILITLADTLIPNTTYTIDFGSAIVDNNEQIPLHGYAYAFATGDHIDTLGIYGQVIHAATLNPVTDLTVGVYDVLQDSVFEKQPFLRIAKTDSLGYFGIRNLRPGNYRVFALNDNSRDYHYQIGEALAFTQQAYQPFIREELQPDSTFAYYYEPSDIVLMYFSEERKPQYFTRATHSEPHLLTLTFANCQDSLPHIQALNSPSGGPSGDTSGDTIDWTKYLLLQHNKGLDTLVYWITDSIAMRDTLRFVLTYQKTDSAYNIFWQSDTIRAVYSTPRLNPRTKAKLDEKKRNQTIGIKTNAKTNFELYDTIRITTDVPLLTFNQENIHLSYKIDTIIKQVPCHLEHNDPIAHRASMQFNLIATLEPAHNYALKIDSGAMTDIYGHSNNIFTTNLKIKRTEDYASLKVLIPAHCQTTGALRIQVLNKKDEPIRELPIVNGQALFQYLPPGECYLRLYEDLNGDGKWTTGDWQLKRQPEPIYYFPAKLNLRANWDFEEIFDYKATEQLNSKPYGILKTQKPTQ